MSERSGLNIWRQLDPSLSFVDESLAELLGYWHRKRGDRPMPKRQEIDPLELREHLGQLSLIDIEAAPFRPRYRLVGSTITEVMGRDVSRRYWDEVYDAETLRDAVHSIEWMVRNRAPLRIFGRDRWPNRRDYDFEILNLPLSSDGAAVDGVLGKLVLRPVAPMAPTATGGGGQEPF